MTEPIRVLFHIDSLYIGGLERKVKRLAMGLDRSRFLPIMSYSTNWGVYGVELQESGIQVERITPGPAGSEDESQSIRKIRDLAPHVFHSFSCKKTADDARAANRAGTPVIITNRGNVRHWATSGTACNWEFDRNALTHYVSACCQTVGNLAQEIEGVHPGKLVVIPNGVEIPQESDEPTIREEAGIPEGAFLVGYAAKYRPLKAHEALLQTWKEVVAVRPEAFLICCGEDDKGRLARLREMVCRMGLAQSVLLLESRRSLDSFYRGLDLYAHASRSEGLSNAILEAMSYGLPVVATAVGGTHEAIEDGVSGMLVRPDASALAAGILAMADSPETRDAMGRAARRRVRERFTIGRMLAGYERMYLAAVEKQSPRESAVAAPRHTGSDSAPRLDDVTVFVTTIGDADNFRDCMAHLERQTVRCRIEVIDRVAPMSAAFAEMHARCTTPYYVQVDEDMLLHPDALARLHELIEDADAAVPLVCAPLWDCDVERPLLGVKIYRHAIVSRFPYRNTISCEVSQLQEMAAAGHHPVILPCEEPDAVCLGEHGKHYSARTIFLRWQRLFQKRNELGHLIWLDPWPERLLERYKSTGDSLHLYAALGAIAGISGRAETGGELDWREANPAFQRLQYYFPPAGKD